VPSALYIVLARPAWAALLALLAFCWFEGPKAGVTGVVGRFLSAPAWVPFARLTYGAYLWHPVVIKLLAGRRGAYYHFDAVDLLGRFALNAALAFACATATFLLVERPTISLVSRALRGPRRRGGPSAAPRGGADCGGAGRGSAAV
jgi:peptidoglycan/LPS O-acetylase OafA/YrhL